MVAKVGLVQLLLKVQVDLRPANVVGNQAASRTVKQRHPHHKARNAVAVAPQREGKVTRQAPQNTDKTGQRDHRVQQPHA